MYLNTLLLAVNYFNRKTPSQMIGRVLDVKNNQKQPPEVFYKKAVLKNFVLFTGKHLCWSLFFNKVAGLRRPAMLLKKKLQHRCFRVNNAKFLKTLILKSVCERLLLNNSIDCNFLTLILLALIFGAQFGKKSLIAVTDILKS